MKGNALIGVSCHFEGEEEFYAVRKDYLSAVESAGGIPIIIPIIEDKEIRELLLKKLDGLLLTGGFGRTKITGKSFIPLKDQNPSRYDFDKLLIEYALNNNIPLLGICRGHQMMNEVCGGETNLQLPNTDISHYQILPKHEPSHKIILIKDTILFDILDTNEIKVNSLHTQGIKNIAPGFKASAIAEDGIIEAIESHNHIFVLGIQFHPEKMIRQEPLFLNIFKRFINSCTIKYQ